MFKKGKDTEERFEIIYEQGSFIVYKIIRDKETGVNYLCHTAGNGMTMTPLLDANGKPVVTGV